VIAIAVSSIDEGGSDVELRFEVRDTGIGLTREQIGNLFCSFSQADSSTARKYGGTGLGLAISKCLAELMGGRIGADSVYGVGSTFWFSARLGKCPALAQQPAPHADLRGRRALVVDDNNLARAVLVDLLDSFGFVVSAAASGAEALQAVRESIARQQPYEIAFVDWLMPQMDGIETTRAMGRLNEGKPSIQVVLVASHAREEAMKAAEAVGIASVLIKPINASLLFNAVMQVLDRGKPAVLPSSTASTAAHVAGLRGRILVAEDNALNQQVACELLTLAGLDVEVAGNGIEAIAKVRAEAFDAVLMDMQMPEMDGIAATQALRKLPEFARLPIIAMTANATAGDKKRCLDAGMNDHVAKPIDPEVLINTLGRWLARNNTPASSRQPALNTADPGALAIDGLDTAIGLKYTLGRPALYWDVLRKFCAGQQDAVTRLETALTSSDRATAERTAHTLKSVAATIGATEIQELAGGIEDGLRDNKSVTDLQTALSILAPRLTRLLDALGKQLDVTPVATGSPGGEPSVAVCARLTRLLDAGDAQATELLRQHDALLRTSLGDAYPTVAAAVHAFDFEEALAILRVAAPS
jgi:two-component system, sensor histidine kinase and response regulator